VTTSQRAPAWDPQPDLAWLLALARRLARPGDDADDLAQETLLVAMQQPERASRSWLAGVLRNLGRMRARTDGRRRARERGVVAGDADTPEDVLARIETLDALRDALGGLDDIDRKLVLGRYATGQTAVALGQQLDLPASTVRTRLQRAKERLRRDVERVRGVGCFAPFGLLDRSSVGTVGGVAMSTGTKIGIGAIAVALLAIGGQRLVAAPSRTEPVTAASPAPRAAPTAKPASIPAEEMRAKRDRIREARDERLAALARAPRIADESDDTVSDRCDDGCIGTLTLQVLLADVMAACRDELPAGAQGKTKFRAHVIAEPDVGAVVDTVEVLEDTVHDAAFTECIVESAPLVQLADPENPVSDSFVFRYTVGKPPQPTTEFLAAHPDLLAQHPEFAALAELEAGQPPAPEDATAFARWLEADLEAQAVFAKWAADQGIDLANVKVAGDPPDAR
jgi:RNA polymerase sigma factor (sigma-70 family)